MVDQISCPTAEISERKSSEKDVGVVLSDRLLQIAAETTLFPSTATDTDNASKDSYGVIYGVELTVTAKFERNIVIKAR